MLESNATGNRVVTKIFPNTAAASLPEIKIGLVLTHVERRPVCNIDAQVLPRILAKRPIRLTFAQAGASIVREPSSGSGKSQTGSKWLCLGSKRHLLDSKWLHKGHQTRQEWLQRLDISPD